MPLAATTYTFRLLPFTDALDQIAAAGLQDVEVWLPHAGTDIAAARKALDERRLRAAAVCAGGVFSPEDDAAVRGSELAVALDAPVLVACVAPVLLGRVVEGLAPGVTLCVENHSNQPLATARQLQAALASESRAAACLDTGHALNAGEEPCAFARALGERLRHVHLKDARVPSPPERLAGRRLRRRLGRRPAPVFPGAGALDVASFRQTLVGLGYEGAVSVEYEGPDTAPALAAAVAAWRAAGLPGRSSGSSRTEDRAGAERR